MNFQKELNDKQFEAVTSADQYLRIIAGAGSGKTRVLTYRIAYLIGNVGIKPHQILAITFTNKVAKEMKERALNLLPNEDLSGLQISTFHSFCALVLRREIQVLGYPKSFTIYDEDDQKRLVKSVLADAGHAKDADLLKETLSYINFKKMDGKLPEDIKSGDFNDYDRTLLPFFEEYEARKAEAYALDFDDLLIFVNKIFSGNDEILRKYQNRFKHILVDEFQDTNNVQFKLLRLLCNSYNSLYVVGDPDQTIYTWRGANNRIILDIDKYFVPLTTIILNQNYRSTKKILDVANELIDKNKERLKKDLFTERESNEDVTLYSFDNADHEAEYVAKTISELAAKGVKLNDIAILYRSSHSSNRIENALVAKRIPYNVYGGLKFYARKEIKDALAYFRLFSNDKDNVSFERIVNFPARGIGAVTLSVIKDEAKNADLSMLQYIRNIDQFPTSIKPSVLIKLKEMVGIMDKFSARLNENLEAYSEVLDEFLTKIGLYQAYTDVEDEDEDKVNNLHQLINDIRIYLKRNPDSNFEEYLQNVSLISSQDEIEDSEKVTLMTVHTAKGLEFKYVFVVCFSQGSFPNGKALEEGTNARMEEERRLAYVAFTRAKDKLYVTYSTDFNYINQQNNRPSQFIKEAGLKYSDTTGIRSAGIENRGRLYSYQFGNSRSQGISTPIKVTPVSPTPLLGANGITRHVGDTCKHKAFGTGKVLSVEGDFIEVMFPTQGKKKLLGSHMALSKPEGN